MLVLFLLSVEQKNGLKRIQEISFMHIECLLLSLSSSAMNFPCTV